MMTSTQAIETSSVSAPNEIEVTARHSVLKFFVGAFIWAWSWLGLGILAGHGFISAPFPLFVAIAAVGPALSAIWVTARETGRTGVRALLAQAVRWRVGAVWYAVVFVGFALIVLAAYLLSMALGGPVVAAPSNAVWLSLPIQFAFLTVFAMGEELGWRGFALPRLQSRYGALIASLLIGVLWGAWHIPVWFIPGAGFDNLPFPVYVVFTVALSIIFTWLYNGSGGSVLIVSLAHAAVNAYGGVWGAAAYALPADERGLNPIVFMTPVLVSVAIVLIVATKSRLGRTPMDLM